MQDRHPFANAISAAIQNAVIPSLQVVCVLLLGAAESHSSVPPFASTFQSCTFASSFVGPDSMCKRRRAVVSFRNVRLFLLDP